MNGLKRLSEGMKAMDLYENKIYKFLEVEQADRIKLKEL